MLSKSHNKISEETLHFLSEQDTFKLVKKSYEKKFARPFNLLKNWNTLRNPAIRSYKLKSDYIHLLDQEPFDENKI